MEAVVPEELALEREAEPGGRVVSKRLARDLCFRNFAAAVINFTHTHNYK